MIDVLMFKDWLSENTNYSEAVISDMASRMKRSDKNIIDTTKIKQMWIDGRNRNAYSNYYRCKFRTWI